LLASERFQVPESATIRSLNRWRRLERVLASDCSTVIVCSTNSWLPQIRREHALIGLAKRAGHRCVFVERPRDIRSLGDRSGRGRWWHGFRPPSPRVEHAGEFASWSTLVPGHLSDGAERLESWLLRRLLTMNVDARTTIVATAPWQWPAVTRVPARRVFDCGDDWSCLLPGRTNRMRRLYRQISEEADAIVVVNESMTRYFDPSKTVIVPNGAGDDVLDPPLSQRPRERQLVYVGTLTQRFDERLVSDLLDAAPDWRLDLFGPCSYRRRGDRPSIELQALLDRLPGRVRWHGAIERTGLASAMDSGRTLLIPHRPELSVGQNTHKLYEYAARGRPTISTRWDSQLAPTGPPHLALADDSDGFCEALRHLESDPSERAVHRRAWAELHHWTNRWTDWSAAVLGPRRRLV
jgi:hypothetical protein